MELVFNAKIRLKNGKKKPFYRCYRFPECTGTHGAHPDGTPMGHPGDARTRALRQKLHAELDKRFPWAMKKGRDATYAWLESNGYGHIGDMTAEDCEVVLGILGVK